MKSKTRDVGDVTIVELTGKITIGEGEIKLRKDIEALLQMGKKKILLDLGHVTFMDSSGVGELVGCYTTVKNRGGAMRLLKLTRKIQDLLQITELITVFEVFDDEAKALESFSA